MVVTTAALLEQMGDLVPDTVALTVVVGWSAAAGQTRRGTSRRSSAAPAMTSFAAVAGDDPSYILYTSGTTGRPKGAAHSQGGRAPGTLNMLASELRGFDHSPVYLHVAPLSHGSGAKILPMMAAGGCNVVVPRFDPELMAATIRARARHPHIPGADDHPAAAGGRP